MVHKQHQTFTPHHANQLKSNVDLREIAVAILGSPVRETASSWVFSAPDRRDSVPSLFIYQNFFKDFGNPDHKGDVFNFLKIYAGMSFNDALNYLTDGMHGNISPVTASTSAKTPITNTPNSAWQQHHTRLIERFHRKLLQNPNILGYLYDQGYDHATIVNQKLGYNPEWHNKIAPGIVFPRYGPDGDLYALKIRCPYGKKRQPDALAVAMQTKPQRMKYSSAPGSKLSQSIYGNLDQPNAPLILTEGEKDRDNVVPAYAKCQCHYGGFGNNPPPRVGIAYHQNTITTVCDDLTRQRRRRTTGCGCIV